MTQTYKVGNVSIGEGMPKICAPLTGTNVDEILEECKMIRASAVDLVEWRVDFFDDALLTDRVLATLPKIKEVLEDLPLIFSFRTAEEGGEKKITDKQYVSLNKAVAVSGHVHIIDIELFRGKNVVEELVTAAKESQIYTIISNHDFNRTPEMEELIRRVTSAIELGGDFPKLAVMPQREEDLLTLLKASLQMKRTYPEQAIIMIAMGSLGMISRLSGEIFGSAITFASVRNASAPGQISVTDMKSILQLIHDAK